MKQHVNGKNGVESPKQYPYARLKGMVGFMDFAKEPGWRPPTIDAELFRKLGLAKGKEREAVRALRFIGLIDEAGAPTEAFDVLNTDYQGIMRRQVQETYSEVFALIPARLANQARLVSFFGTAVDTAEYQAKLFVWFCQQGSIELPNMEKSFHRARFDKDESHDEIEHE